MTKKSSTTAKLTEHGENKELNQEILIEETRHKKWNLPFTFSTSMIRRTFLFFLLLTMFVLVVTPLLTYVFFVRDMATKESIINRKNSGVILTDKNDKPFFTFYQATTKKSVPLKDISKNVLNAVIAIEDKNFYKHPGFSFRGIGRALFVAVQNNQFSQGGSTISQQVVKNTLLSQERTFLRKYQELVLALELERRYSKNDILEMYLNTVYFGEGAFGIEDAANTYFNKSATDVTLAEAALLAGILPAPSAYSPLSGNATKAYQRQAIVLSEMKRQGMISVAEEQSARSTKVTFNPMKSDLNQTAPHFALMVKDALIEKYGEQQVARSGYTVKTTLDVALQTYAEQVVTNQVTRLKGNNVSNGAAVILDAENGNILALVGSWNWEDETNGKINMAITPRQPGSSFKPLVFAKAFEDRTLTPGSILEDKQIEFVGGYKPKNYDGKFRGPVTVRRALANSLNIPALLAMQQVTVPKGIDIAKKLGISTIKEPSQYGLSLALGAAEIPLLEMTAAFAVFANEGNRNESNTILEIKDKTGTIIYTYTPSPEKVLDERVAFQISSILSDNNARAEVFGGSLTLSRPAAVKTGTTEDYRDSLTVGYTPGYVVGVWVGNNNNEPMDGIAGSSGAAPIWRQLLEKAFAGTPVKQFRQPVGIVKQNICKENGLKATLATTSAYPEFFLPGTLPTKNCIADPSPTENSIPSISPIQEENNPTATPTPQPTQEIKPTEANPTKIIDITAPPLLPT